MQVGFQRPFMTRRLFHALKKELDQIENHDLPQLDALIEAIETSKDFLHYEVALHSREMLRTRASFIKKNFENPVVIGP